MSWAKGQEFEDRAIKYLESKGYEIIDRNWHAKRYGELDLICRIQSKKLLVFVEVKGRNSKVFERDGLSSIDRRKAKKLIHSINMYLNYQEIKDPNNNYSTRFDLILVSGKGEIIHIENIALMDFS